MRVLVDYRGEDKMASFKRDILDHLFSKTMLYFETEVEEESLKRVKVKAKPKALRVR